MTVREHLTKLHERMAAHNVEKGKFHKRMAGQL